MPSWYNGSVPSESRTVAPGPDERSVRTPDGRVLRVPKDWELLPPGDAALTRRVKAAGPSWTVAERRRGRSYSRGVFAASSTIARIAADLKAERADPAYTKRLEAGRQRRAREQVAYVEEFTGQVAAFLAFAARYRKLEVRLAAAIAAHATPVGSGTVARTSRIPVERRAEAATIAWLRHNTTAYDDMVIARRKGVRREVRRELAARSRRLLDQYRSGLEIPHRECPLENALDAS